MRTSEIFRKTEIPDFRVVFPVLKERYPFIVSLNGDHMEEVLEKAYKVAVRHRMGDLPDGKLDEELKELAREHKELTRSHRQTGGISLLGVVLDLVTGLEELEDF